MDVFLEPKLDPDAPPPDPSQAAKSKFQPKAKPRGKGRPSTAPPSSKPRAQATPHQKEQEGPEKEKVDEGAPQVPSSDASIHLDAGEDSPPILITPKAEPLESFPLLSDVFVKLEKFDDGEDAEMKHGEDVEMKKEEIVKKEEPIPDLPSSPSFVENVDRVVREIDVYLCPGIADTKLYLLQYPLRPHWRPYGLEERCDSVRVKPKLTKLEMDLVVDTTGDNYDQDADEHLLIKKQTLGSSKIALTTNYAVGLLRGNQLHLAPVDAILQMRPSMKYLDEADVKKKNSRKVIEDEDMVDVENDDEEEEKEEKPQLVALKVEVKKQETERQEQMRLQSHAHLRQIDAAEPWISLETHGTDSPITDQIRHALTSIVGDKIPFGMPLTEYINHLVPGRASLSVFEAAAHDSNVDEGLSRSFLDTLPLEQRFEKLLSKGRVHILQFERLMKLAPAGCKEEEVLSVLDDMAHLVQGCWVAASSLRYTGEICIVRDYILSLFTKSRVIRHDHLEELQVPKEIIRDVLLPLAVQRPTEGGWEFQESTDTSFLKRHQAVAKEQMQRWTENEEQIKFAAIGLRMGTSSNKNSSLSQHTSGMLHSGDKIVNAIQSGLGRNKTSTFSGEWTMSEETRAALPGALREIFARHNVCSLQLICQSLRELAITKAAAPNANPKVVGAAVAAAKGASAPLPELTAAINQVASNMDGVYFLTKLGNPSLDPFRDVVIALLRAKGATTGLKRVDIVEASKIALKTEVQANIYQKVLKELCYTKGGAWVLKPGDGRPA